MATAQAVTPPPETVLEEAARITSQDRQRYYGHPADNHGNTAEFWTSYLRRRFDGSTEIVLTARDVCMMMVLLKISRDANSRKRDNLVDGCGYLRNAEQIEERENEELLYAGEEGEDDGGGGATAESVAILAQKVGEAVDARIRAACTSPWPTDDAPSAPAEEFHGGKFYPAGQAPRPA